MRRRPLRRFTVDELERHEPQKVTSVNEMIKECEENEEGFPHKRVRGRVEKLLIKIQENDEVKSQSFRDLLRAGTENTSRSGKQIIEETDEFSSDDLS